MKEQSVETEEGVVVPVEGTKLTSSILQSPSDPDATFRHKSGENHIGNSWNFVEVHDQESETDFIMHADLEENIHSDAQFGQDFVRNHPLSRDIDTLAVDGAYYRLEIVKEANEKDLEIIFSHMTSKKGF